MAFQFYCPNGHLLQGDESQQGQQSQCPMCGAMFIVPMLSPPAGGPPPNQPTPPPQQPAAPPQQPPAKPAEPPKPAEPQIFHIPCPNGHVLESPDNILGQQVLCPYCNVQFELRQEDSQEFQAEQSAARRRREEEINEQWVEWSILAAVGVGVMFAVMLVWTFGLKPFLDPYMQGYSPLWGVLGCGIVTIAIVFLIAKQRRKKRAAAAKARDA